MLWVLISQLNLLSCLTNPFSIKSAWSIESFDYNVFWCKVVLFVHPQNHLFLMRNAQNWTSLGRGSFVFYWKECFPCNIAEVSVADWIYVQTQFIFIMYSTMVHKNLTMTCTWVQMMAYTQWKQHFMVNWSWVCIKTTSVKAPSHSHSLSSGSSISWGQW